MLTAQNISDLSEALRMVLNIEEANLERSDHPTAEEGQDFGPMVSYDDTEIWHNGEYYVVDSIVYSSPPDVCDIADENIFTEFDKARDEFLKRIFLSNLYRYQDYKNDEAYVKQLEEEEKLMASYQNELSLDNLVDKIN